MLLTVLMIEEARIAELSGRHHRLICSERCYNAKGPYDYRRRCICEGRNHGVGYEKSLKNTKLMMSETETNGRVIFNKGLLKNVEATELDRLPIPTRRAYVKRNPDSAAAILYQKYHHKIRA